MSNKMRFFNIYKLKRAQGKCYLHYSNSEFFIICSKNDNYENSRATRIEIELTSALGAHEGTTS